MTSEDPASRLDIPEPAGGAGATGAAGLVLGGGGARGAYEVGVAHFIFEDLARRLGFVPRFPVVTGSSAGAINACGIGGHADEPLKGVARLAWSWRGLEVERMVKPDRLELLGIVRGLLGGDPHNVGLCKLRGGILDPRPFRTLLAQSLPLGGLAEQLRKGRLSSIAIGATEVATGMSAVFVAAAERGGMGWRRRGTRVCPVDRIRLGHVLASSAMPFLLPPLVLDGRLYCDGSLRQHVPLSPALHLGADRLVVVSTQTSTEARMPLVEREREEAYASPLFLLGRALDALTLDRLDDDISELERLNDVVAAGRRAFGDRFDEDLGRALAAAGRPALRPVELVVIRPGESLGRLAVDVARSRRVRGRLRGPLGRLFGRLLEGEAEHEAELLSFLLFDGAFASELMALGRADAHRQEAALAAMLGDQPSVAAATS